jgi:hypothetical protein
MNQVQIAATIHDQIKAADKWCFMACGARDLTAMVRTNDSRGGLKFRVTITGPQTKHYILIELTYNDEYRVKRIKIKIKRGTCETVVVVVVERETMCHCDNLAEVVYESCNIK